jgi:hypothetical protein
MRRLRSKGNVSILLCLIITGLFGFTAFAIDIGLVYIERTKLFSALDSAALAASLELPNGDTKTKAAATLYLEKNGVDPSTASIVIATDHKSIEIQAVKGVKHLFAQIIGISSSEVRARSKAVIGPAKAIKNGVRPFAVEMFNYTYGGTVVLKEGAGDGYQGNYNAIALGGTGASNFQANALYGYKGMISIGDYIDTETGNMAGATNAIKNYINGEFSSFSSFPRDSIRLWTIPLVNTLMVNGRSTVEVLGFGEFYVEDVQQKSGKIEITGRFVRYVTSAPIDNTLVDKGAYGTKLSK